MPDTGMAMTIIKSRPRVEVTLTSLARDVVLTSPSDEVAELLSNAKEYPHIIREILAIGARQILHDAKTRVRYAMEDEYLDARERGIVRHATALNGRATLFDWKLPVSGISLGDATVVDLTAAAEFHAKRAGFERERTSMYQAVAKRLTASKAATVREGIKEDALAKIMKNAITAT